MSDQARWDLQEPLDRLRSHSRAAQQNALATKDPKLCLANICRVFHWGLRAAAYANRLKAYDAEKAKP